MHTLPMNQQSPSPGVLDTTRRRFLQLLPSAGLVSTVAAGAGAALLPGALLAVASAEAAAQGSTPGSSAAGEVESLPNLPKITDAMIEAAAAIAGVTFTPEQRQAMLEGLNNQREDIAEVRRIPLPNSVAPSLVQDPVLPGTVLHTVRLPAKMGATPSVAHVAVSNEDQVAFATVRQLGELLRTKKMTSVALTKLYLGRLKRYDPLLHFVITFTEERALTQAARADEEMAAGRYRGPLHGIPGVRRICWR